METIGNQSLDATKAIIAMSKQDRARLRVVVDFDTAILAAAEAMLIGKWRDASSDQEVMLAELLGPALSLKMFKGRLYQGVAPTTAELDAMINMCGDAVAATFMVAADGNWVDNSGNAVLLDPCIRKLEAALQKAIEHRHAVRVASAPAGKIEVEMLENILSLLAQRPGVPKNG